MTGAGLVALARTKIGERYVLGADVPLDDADYDGPWDCAEFASWLAYQATQRLVGCIDNGAAVARAEPYSAAWALDIRSGIVESIPIDEAIRTAGAVLVRAPARGKIGHVAISDGDGGTVEAHSAQRGVIASTARGRVWTHAGKIRGVDYASPDPLGAGQIEPAVLRAGSRGADVRALQEALAERTRHLSAIAGVTLRGLDPGPIDGDFGPMTRGAVYAWQVACGLVPDGEVVRSGETARSLGLS